MPNTNQAKKRMRQDEEKRMANKQMKTRMKSAMKKVLQAENPEQAQAAIPEALRCIDKAAKRNIIHANAAARYKSRVTRAAAK